MRICDGLAMVGSGQCGLSAAWDCHVYALRGARGIVLIDAGCGRGSGRILHNLADEWPGEPVVALLLTHCHMDHCGGAAAIRRQTGCRVFAPEASRAILERGDAEASGLRRAREQGLYPPELELAPCPVDVAVRDGETFEAAGLTWTPIHVRGHSPDAHCYLLRSGDAHWLFAGDVVFHGGLLGVINAAGSGMDGYRADLHKLGALGVDGLFPGHGLFTLQGGQRHLDAAIAQASQGFLGRQIGQWDLLF